MKVRQRPRPLIKRNRWIRINWRSQFADPSDGRSTSQRPAMPLGLPTDLHEFSISPVWPDLERPVFGFDRLENAGDLEVLRLLDWAGVTLQDWESCDARLRSELVRALRGVAGIRELIHVAVLPESVVDRASANAVASESVRELGKLSERLEISRSEHGGVLRTVDLHRHHPFARAVFSMLVRSFTNIKRSRRFKRAKEGTPLVWKHYASEVASYLKKKVNRRFLIGAPRITPSDISRLKVVSPTELTSEVLNRWPHRHGISTDELRRTNLKRGRRS